MFDMPYKDVSGDGTGKWKYVAGNYVTALNCRDGNEMFQSEQGYNAD